MILYTLCCAADHVFEAWFRDGATYDEQSAAGGIVCPVCGDASVAKAPMAPRIARGGGIGGMSAGDSGNEADTAPALATYTNDKAVEVRRMLTELRRQVEDNSDYVGGNFAEEARKIHYRETQERSIHGEATEDQARELTDEGIKIGRIPWLPRTDS